MNQVIIAEKLSKKYMISHENQGAYSTIVQTVTEASKKWARRILNPFLKNENKKTFEEFWALDDVSFEINEGDRVGILGKNGAGKSTLLKVLSRIVDPTAGRVKIKGRVASLLEVGTGFHPELTGKENIYLNGAILGMGRAEIAAKYDEIVAFAEIEKFLDTPVKYYSSGMYARLGFAIAAHLDPDILIVDEVLAVGDAQFQAKCLKKLDDVSQTGRTILFVSHNTAAILHLCNRGILLQNGKIKVSGSIEECVNAYVKTFRPQEMEWKGNIGNQHLSIQKMEIIPHQERTFFYTNEEAAICIMGAVLEPSKEFLLGLEVKDKRDHVIAHYFIDQVKLNQAGPFSVSLNLKLDYFWEGEYSLALSYTSLNKKSTLQDNVQLKLTLYRPQEGSRFIDHSNKQGVILPYSINYSTT